MSVNRLLIGLGSMAFAVAALVFIMNSAPTFAANGSGGTFASAVQLAPPIQRSTLVPRTPDLGGLPPIDLGALNSLKTPTPTPAADETIVVLDNDFEKCSPINDEFVLIECKNGQLSFTRKETAGTRYIYYRPVVGDAMIEVTARLPSQKNARYGVIFRLDDTFRNYYLLGVTNEGEYGLFRYAEDHYETLIPYTESFNVGNASFPTKIKIVNQGDVIAINLGGEWVDSIRDPNLASGKVALFVEPDEANQTVLFDDFRISEILSPLEVPEPRVIAPAATPTSASGDLPVVIFDSTPTPEVQQPTQTPFIIVVTATPQPTSAQPTRAPTRVPTRAPTSRPTQAPTEAANACEAPQHEAFFYISNNYQGTMMRFTIGGGEWGTHDFDVPGDGLYYLIHMPPGKYTYTAFIPGKGKANGERTSYVGGQCYTLRFSP